MTGGEDAAECALLKFGISGSQFSNPGTLPAKTVNFYTGSAGPGASFSASTPTEELLWSSQPSVDAYDVLLLPNQGVPNDTAATPAHQQELINFSNASGRVFATRFSYDWLYNDAPFSGTAVWSVDPTTSKTFADDPQTGYVSTTFPRGAAMAQWLQTVGASSVSGQISLAHLHDDLTSIISPSSEFLNVQDASLGNVPMQYTFDTPVGGQTLIGRVLFNDYTVEHPASSTDGSIFPSECTSGPMTAQEYLFEYSLFDLSNFITQPIAPAITVNVASSPTVFALGDSADTITINAEDTNSAGLYGTVTVAVSLPAGLTASAISGSGWSCSLGTLQCTRTFLYSGMDVPITVTVSVAQNAQSPAMVTASVSGGGLQSSVSGQGSISIEQPQTITFSLNAPAAAAYNSSFTVAATASSGLPVTFTSAGSCGNVGSTYTMVSGTGVCSVIANQAGNGNYNAATQVTQTTNATKASQTITFTTNAPASAVMASSFTVVATASSGLPLLFVQEAGSACGGSGPPGPFVVLAAPSLCILDVEQLGSANYQAATVNEFTTTTPGPTSIAVTNVSPASETFGLNAPVTITAVLSWQNPGSIPQFEGLNYPSVTFGGNGNGTYGAASCGLSAGNALTCTATYTPTAADVAGSYTESATFNGTSVNSIGPFPNSWSASSSTQTNNFTIGGATSATSVATSGSPSTYGGAVTFTASVTGQNGEVTGRDPRGRHGNGKSNAVGTLTGTVTWSANTGCSASTVSGYPGVATCTTSVLPVGSDTVTATYNGDSNHSTSTNSTSQTVSKATATISVSSVSPAAEDYGLDSPVTITAVLSWSGSGSAPTAADVSVGGNGLSGYGATSCGAPSGDTITCTATYTPTVADGAGSYTESASFSGDTNYGASSSTQTNNFTINAASSTTAVTSTPNPSTYARSVTFTATINGENGLVRGRNGKRGKPQDVTGTMTWSANTGCNPSTVTWSETNQSATATCTTSSATHLPVGTDAVTATYSGDANHSGSTGSVNQVVQGGISTTISVTNVSPASETYGANSQITITAVLSWTGYGTAPTASDVTISGNGTGTYAATTCGTRSGETITCTATYTPNNDAAGTFTETASFSGDTNYAASSSSQTNNFTINTASSMTAVTSTPNPSTYAQSVTFTATINGENGLVRGRNGKRGKPQDVTGTVTWSANTGCNPSTVTWSETNQSATATCTTSSATHLPVGTDTVTANYSGDSNLNSGSGSVDQTVNPASQTITCNPNAPPTILNNEAFTMVCSASTPVTYSNAGLCTGSGGTYTVSGAAGKTCMVTVNAAATGSYSAAPAVTEATTIEPGYAPTVNLTASTASTPYQSTFTVTPSTNAGNNNDVTITSLTATVCTVSGATVTVLKGTATCLLKASWPATYVYRAATAEVHVATTALSTTTTITTTTGTDHMTVYFTVVGSNSATPPGPEVTVSDGNGHSCRGTATEGYCKLAPAFAGSGSATLTTTYPGNKDYATSTSASYPITY